jgi:hypothetical protein
MEPVCREKKMVPVLIVARHKSAYDYRQWLMLPRNAFHLALI